MRRYEHRTSILIPGVKVPLSTRFTMPQLEAIDRARGDKPLGVYVVDSARDLLVRRGATDPEDFKTAALEDDMPLSTWLREVAVGTAGHPVKYVIRGL
jgi:hypothetical protein